VFFQNQLYRNIRSTVREISHLFINILLNAPSSILSNKAEESLKQETDIFSYYEHFVLGASRFNKILIKR
jgi:hypothetical protein